MKVVKKLSLIAFIAMTALTSCITPSQVNYLQDMHHGSQIELENKFQATIAPYDELNIYVFASNEELAKPFNIGGGITTGSYAGNYRGTYLVDVNGNIQFPIPFFLQLAITRKTNIQSS